MVVVGVGWQFGSFIVSGCQTRETTRADIHYIEQVLSYDWVGPVRRAELQRDLDVTAPLLKEWDESMKVCDLIAPMLPKATPHWWTIGGMRAGPPAARPVGAVGAPPAAGPESSSPTH